MKGLIPSIAGDLCALHFYMADYRIYSNVIRAEEHQRKTCFASLLSASICARGFWDDHHKALLQLIEIGHVTVVFPPRAVRR